MTWVAARVAGATGGEVWVVAGGLADGAAGGGLAPADGTGADRGVCW